MSQTNWDENVHMYDFSRMKQDGTECHLLRTADADMADACEKHFQMSRGTPTSVARKQTSTAVKYEPYKKRTGSKLSARNDSVPRTVPPVLAEHHHRKQEGADTTRYKSYTSTSSKQRTHPAHMYDFSRMKQDGTECHLLDADMDNACEKHAVSTLVQICLRMCVRAVVTVAPHCIAGQDR